MCLRWTFSKNQDRLWQTDRTYHLSKEHSKRKTASSKYLWLFETLCYLGYLWAICGPHSPEWNIFSLGLRKVVTVRFSLLSQDLEMLLWWEWHILCMAAELCQVSWDMKGEFLKALRAAGMANKGRLTHTSHQKPPKLKTTHVTFYPHHHYILVRRASWTWPNGKTGWRPSNFFQVSERIYVNNVR